MRAYSAVVTEAQLGRSTLRLTDGFRSRVPDASRRSSTVLMPKTMHTNDHDRVDERTHS